VDKVEIFNVVDQTSQLKDMLDNIRQSQEILSESQQRIKESQEVLYMDHENTKQNLNSARASATYNVNVSNAKDTQNNKDIVKDVKAPKKVEEVKVTKELTKDINQNSNNSNNPDMSV